MLLTLSRIPANWQVSQTWSVALSVHKAMTMPRFVCSGIFNLSALVALEMTTVGIHMVCMLTDAAF